MVGSAWMLRVVLSGALSLCLAAGADACTRALFVATNGTVITGRSMDWMEDMHTSLWVFPRGMERHGAAGASSLKWRSRFGSVTSAAYDFSTADGMNEKGLVASVLYLDESDYGRVDPARLHLSISVWGQYALDNFATVAEAVQALRAEPFQIIAPKLPNGVAAQLHLALSDPSGDSAVFEYVSGKLVVHHGSQYKVMTNSPTYDQQLAVNRYWEDVGGKVFLPGTDRPADRFARTSFLIGAIPRALSPAYIGDVPDRKFEFQAVASVLSVIRAISVPYGISGQTAPNQGSTLWRTVSDQTHRVYYFDSASRPNTFWVSMEKLNLEEGAPVLKLGLAKGEIYSGEASGQFRPASAFAFLPAGPS